MVAPGFWDNQEKAQQQVDEMRRLSLTLKPLTGLISAADDLEALLELAEEDDTGETEADLSSLLESLERDRKSVV